MNGVSGIFPENLYGTKKVCSYTIREKYHRHINDMFMKNTHHRETYDVLL